LLMDEGKNHAKRMKREEIELVQMQG